MTIFLYAQACRSMERAFTYLLLTMDAVNTGVEMLLRNRLIGLLAFNISTVIFCVNIGLQYKTINQKIIENGESSRYGE